MEYFVLKFVISDISDSYTMVCPPVRRDNLRALSRVLSPVQADKPWYMYNYFYTSLIGVDPAQYEIFIAQVCNNWQGWCNSR